MPVRRTLSAEATMTQEIFEILTAPKPEGFIESPDKRFLTVPAPLHPYPPTDELKQALEVLKPLRSLPDALLYEHEPATTYPPTMEYGYPITPEQILQFAELCPKLHSKKRKNENEPAMFLAACWLTDMADCIISVRKALNAPYGVVASLGNNQDLPDLLTSRQVTDENISVLRDALEITDGSRPRWFVSGKIWWWRLP